MQTGAPVKARQRGTRLLVTVSSTNSCKIIKRIISESGCTPADTLFVGGTFGNGSYSPNKKRKTTRNNPDESRWRRLVKEGSGIDPANIGHIHGRCFACCVIRNATKISPSQLSQLSNCISAGGVLIAVFEGSNCFFDNEILDLRLRSAIKHDGVFHLDIKHDGVLEGSFSSEAMESDYASDKDRLNSIMEDFPQNLLLNACASADQAQCLTRIQGYLSSAQGGGTVCVSGPASADCPGLLGLVAAAAISEGLRNIFVTSARPDLVFGVFLAAQRGLEQLGLEEGIDFTLSAWDASTSFYAGDTQIEKAISAMKSVPAVVKIQVLRRSESLLATRQSIQFVFPSEIKGLIQPDLLLVHEAATLPLQIVVDSIGPFLTVMSMSTQGHGASGEARTLELLDVLEPAALLAFRSTDEQNAFLELKMNTPPNFSANCPLASSINSALCLDANKLVPVDEISSLAPWNQCDLYKVNTGLLLSNFGNQSSDTLLMRIGGLLWGSESHFDGDWLKELQHQDLYIFCTPQENGLDPKPLVAITTCKSSAINHWQPTSTQFLEVKRIAAHSGIRRHGYGSAAVRALLEYLGSSDISLQNDDAAKRPDTALLSSTRFLSPIDMRDTQVIARMDLNDCTFAFFKSLEFVPIWTSNFPDEHSGQFEVIMANPGSKWVESRLIRLTDKWLALLGSTYSTIPAQLATDVLIHIAKHRNNASTPLVHGLTDTRLRFFLDSFDMSRLCRHISMPLETSLVGDLWPIIAFLFFRGHCQRLKASESDAEVDSLVLGPFQQAALLGVGLQGKTLKVLATELKIPRDQLAIQMRIGIKNCFIYLEGLRTSKAVRAVAQQEAETISGLKAGGDIDSIAEDMRYVGESVSL